MLRIAHNKNYKKKSYKKIEENENIEIDVLSQLVFGLSQTGNHWKLLRFYRVRSFRTFSREQIGSYESGVVALLLVIIIGIAP